MKRLFGLIVALFTYSAGAAPALPPGFVDVAGLIPDLVVEMRYHGYHNFVGRPVEGYEAERCLLTQEAAAALADVQAEVRHMGMSLKVYDCYRPQRAVDHFVRWAGDPADQLTRQEFYPTVAKENLFRDGYIASRSGHSRGSTVDLTLVALPATHQRLFKAGEPLSECFLPAKRRFPDNGLDMGTGYDCFHELAHTANLQLGPKQRHNRQLLKAAMERHGFRNYELEWWHYTLANEPYPETYFDFPIR